MQIFNYFVAFTAKYLYINSPFILLLRLFGSLNYPSFFYIVLVRSRAVCGCARARAVCGVVGTYQYRMIAGFEPDLPHRDPSEPATIPSFVNLVFCV